MLMEVPGSLRSPGMTGGMAARHLFGRRQRRGGFRFGLGRGLGRVLLALLEDELVALDGDLAQARSSCAPVPAGIRRPTMTFSLRPSSVSALPLTAASVSTRVVSWNDAAEMKERVCSDALVMPSSTGWPMRRLLALGFDRAR